jgi:hypothetical protein
MTRPLGDVLDADHADQFVDVRLMRAAPPSSVSTTTVMRETPGSRYADAQRLDVESATPEE